MVKQITEILQKFNLNIQLSEILEKYNEPHRFYHTFKHIEFLIKKINELFDENEKDRNILILAALFHDIIYDPQRTDNELQSVNFLKSKLFDDITADINKVCDIIMATRTHEKTGDDIIDVFCYLDIWFLKKGTFLEILESERNIFKEYQFADYATYKVERCKFLQGIIDSNCCLDNENNLRLLIDWVKTHKINVGVYAGSFNPFHKGHLDILNKGQKIFDKVILAIGVNIEKSTSEDYIKELKSNVQSLKEKFNVEVCFYEGLLTDFIKDKQDVDGINITLMRGLRNGSDLSYENTQVQFMLDMCPELRVVYLKSDINYEHISSSAIRMLENYGENLKDRYLP